MKKNRRHRHHFSTFVCALAIAVGISLFLVKEADTPTTSFLSSLAPTIPSPAPTPPTISSDETSGDMYRAFTVSGESPGAELAKEVGANNVLPVLAFNRLDAQHIPPHALIIIPRTLDWNTLSPFPAILPSAQNIPKLFVISQRVQAFGAYENGALVRWGPVSTGKASTPTPSRLYTTNWKGKLVVSSTKDEWVMPWYFNLDNDGGVSMHQYDLPGYPASHACVRMLEADAMWVYDWADQWILAPDGNTELAPGTPVIVFGSYDYNSPAPWKELPHDPQASTITADELSQVVASYLPAIQEDLATRARVEAEQGQ